MFTHYAGLLDTKARRADHLRGYGIDPCICDSCKDGTTSDARRARIGVAINTESPDLETDLLDRIATIEREGLEASVAYATALLCLSMLYQKQGPASKAAKYLRKAEAYKVFCPDLFEIAFMPFFF
jgi:hypothetical protein